jgi:hypothetical protein
MFHDKDLVEDVILSIVLCITFIVFAAMAESASPTQHSDGSIDMSFQRGD